MTSHLACEVNHADDDSKFWPEGVTRCKPQFFGLWLLAFLGLAAWATVSAFLVLYKGLNQTG